MPVLQLSLQSPFGEITLFEEDGAIVALEWGRAGTQASSDLLAHATAALQDYFDTGILPVTLPLNPFGTPYQRAVWNALRSIPDGHTRTYKEIAASVGGSARSVGNANARNPIPILIPCHRVVAAQGLGGYSGAEGLTTKRALLALEKTSLGIANPAII